MEAARKGRTRETEVEGAEDVPSGDSDLRLGAGGKEMAGDVM